MYMNWTSSSGASGRFEYLVGQSGAVVPDEGEGGMWRRAVFAPFGMHNCLPIPESTTGNLGQQPGVPYDDKVRESPFPMICLVISYF